MKTESIVFAVVGTFFGLLVGWILGTQHATLSRAAAPQQAVQQQAAAAAPAAKPIDENRAAELRAAVQRDASDVTSRVELGNLYYDAGRFDEAVKWYEEAIKLDPKNINVSTDLGVSYWNLNQPDRALQQFDHSLALDPRHTITLLNQGIVRAFGKQDLEGASASWQKVIDIAPNSQEGQAAKRMLDGVKAGHPGTPTSASPSPRG